MKASYTVTRQSAKIPPNSESFADRKHHLGGSVNKPHNRQASHYNTSARHPQYLGTG